MDIVTTANRVRTYFLSLPEVSDCFLEGSVAYNTYDSYSDIDILVDVSGRDNSQYTLQLPALLGAITPVIFSDYAPSLMPGQYIVSCAISAENPFLWVDIKCVATPHCSTLQRDDFPYDLFTHTLKVFVANCKHFLRGDDCTRDIARMHQRLFPQQDTLPPETMLAQAFS